MEKLLTTQELAERWQCSCDTVCNHISKGLRAIPISKKDYRYALNDVLDYEERLKETFNSYSDLTVKSKVNRFKYQKNYYKYELI